MIDHLDLETEQHLEAVHLLSMYRPVLLFIYDPDDPVGAIAFRVFAKAWLDARPSEVPFYTLERSKHHKQYLQLVRRYGAANCTAQVLVVHQGRCVHLRCDADIVAADVRAAIETCAAATYKPAPEPMITIKKPY